MFSFWLQTVRRDCVWRILWLEFVRNVLRIVMGKTERDSGIRSNRLTDRRLNAFSTYLDWSRRKLPKDFPLVKLTLSLSTMKFHTSASTRRAQLSVAVTTVRSTDLLNFNVKTRVNTDQTRLKRPSLIKTSLSVQYSSPILALVLRLKGSRGQ